MTTTAEVGLTLDGSGFGLGTRSQRYAAIIDDGVVTELMVEPNPGLDVSSAEAVLALIGKQLQDITLPVTPQKLPDGMLYRTRVRVQPVELRVTPERATLLAGELLEGRPRGDVGTSLRMAYRIKDVDTARGYARYFWKATPLVA